MSLLPSRCLLPPLQVSAALLQEPSSRPSSSGGHQQAAASAGVLIPDVRQPVLPERAAARTRAGSGGARLGLHYTRGKLPGVIQLLISDRRCDAGCADGLLAARVPPPPSGDTREPRYRKEAAAASACHRRAQRTPQLRHQNPARVTGQPLSVAARTGAPPSRETGSRRGEPEPPHSSCSGKERRSELESVGHRKRHSPPALSSEVSHVHLATPLPEQLFAERPAAAADRLHGEDEARLRHNRWLLPPHSITTCRRWGA